MNNKFKCLNSNEKPREKLLRYGAQYLTDQELIALILRTGTKNNSSLDIARNILTKYSNIKELMYTDILQITKNNSIGIAKGSSLIAACELSKRIINFKDNKVKIHNPKDVYNYMKQFLFAKSKEHLYLINLDHKNSIISTKLLTIGTTTEALIEPKEIYKLALENNSHSIILVHNHPSNDSTPSQEDIEITKKIAKIGRSIGITLTDHIIFCDTTFSSLKALNLFSNY